MKRMTIVIPVYNEAENLPRLQRVLHDYLAESPVETKILLVDDGSTDGGLEEIRVMCEDPRFDYLAFAQNRGLSTAIKAGFSCADTPLVGYMDADLQTTPFDFDKLLPFIDEYEAVVGYREKRRDTLAKRIQSRLANAVRRRLIGDGIIDTGCPLKLFRTETVRNIPFFDGMHRFLPALVMMEGGRVKQVPVRHFERVAGYSKFNLFNRSLRPLQDMLAFRWMRARRIEYRIKASSLQRCE